MAYVVMVVYEFDTVMYGNDLLGVVDSSVKAFELIREFNISEEFKDEFTEGTKVIWSDHRCKDLVTDTRTGRAAYEETVYTSEESDVCGSVTFAIYEIEGKLTKE